MNDGLEKVSYVSTIFLKQKDMELMTFFNINTPKDLRMAETALSKYTCNQELQVTRNKKLRLLLKKSLTTYRVFHGKVNE